MGGDPHRPVRTEAAEATPREHVVSVGFSEQTSPHVEPEDPTLHGRRQNPCALGIEPARPVKTERSVVGIALPREQPIGYNVRQVGSHLVGNSRWGELPSRQAPAGGPTANLLGGTVELDG